MKVNTKDMRAKIIKIVAAYPQAANDDKLLTALVWNEEGWNDFANIYANLQHVSSAGTISRTRRKLQEEGLIKPSEKTIEARYNDYKQARMSI